MKNRILFIFLILNFTVFTILSQSSDFDKTVGFDKSITDVNVFNKNEIGSEKSTSQVVGAEKKDEKVMFKDKSVRVLRACWPYITTTFIFGSLYFTYKISNKVGLTKEIKDIFKVIGKTKTLKFLLLGGFATCFVGGYYILNHL